MDRSVRWLLRGRVSRLDQDSFPPSWVVQDGELHAVPGAGVDLITRETFTDFELEFEWRVSPGGNSGVMYRVVENDAPSWTSGPEYQVLDDVEARGRPGTTYLGGRSYALIAPNGDKRLEPVGSSIRGGSSWTTVTWNTG